tara:strand:- start:581 stop:961 length:381 start_codon:yes stop_codon:yes gene_type:complete
MKKDIAIIVFLTISYLCYFLVPRDAFSQVTISSSNGQSDNYDEIEIKGVKCRNGLTGPTQLEFGIAQQNEEAFFNDDVINSNNNGKAVAYGKITYTFGTPKRLDCSRLYELHIELLQEQLRKIQQE